MSEPSDREWVDEVIESGDETAFRALYRRHTPRIYGFALRILAGSEADAEEVVQETWVRAVRRLDGFRWRSELATWLCGIAHNLCREKLRRRKLEDREAAPSPPEEPAPPRGGLRLDLERAIALLPARCRSVLVLHDVEGWTHREIAKGLGISSGTSKSQLFEARRKVRTWLEGARHEAAG